MKVGELETPWFDYELLRRFVNMSASRQVELSKRSTPLGKRIKAMLAEFMDYNAHVDRRTHKLLFLNCGKTTCQVCQPRNPRSLEFFRLLNVHGTFYSPIEDPACPGHFRTYLQCKKATESFSFIPDMSLPSLLSRKRKFEVALESAGNGNEGGTAKAPVEISCALCVPPASFIFSSHADRKRHLLAHRLQGTNSNLVRSQKRARLDTQRGPQTGKPPALNLKKCAKCGKCFPTIKGEPTFPCPCFVSCTCTLPRSVLLYCYFLTTMSFCVFPCACQGRRAHQREAGHRQRRSLLKVNSRNIAPDAQISRGQKEARVEYINQRADLVSGCLVKDAVGMVVPCNNVGGTKPYAKADLNYDLKRGLIVVENSTGADDDKDNDEQNGKVQSRGAVLVENAEDSGSEDDVVAPGETNRRVISSEDDEDDDEEAAGTGEGGSSCYAANAGNLDDAAEQRLLHALGCNDSSSSSGSDIENQLSD